MTRIVQKLCTPVSFAENESRFSSKSTTVSFANKDKDQDLFKAQVSLSSRSLRRELEEEVKVNDATFRPGPAGPFLLTNLLPALPLLRKASLNFHPSLVGATPAGRSAPLFTSSAQLPSAQARQVCCPIKELAQAHTGASFGCWEAIQIMRCDLFKLKAM